MDEPDEAGPAPAAAAHAHGGGAGEPPETQDVETATLSSVEEDAAAPALLAMDPHEQSFQFRSEVAASHSESVAQEELDPPASVAHGNGGGHGGPAEILQIETAASLYPADEPAASHAQVAQDHAASHEHDLIV